MTVTGSRWFRHTVAHASRAYDYWLGGKDNFAADRSVAAEIIAVRPTIIRDIRANRAFLGRAVHFLAAKAGIRQFLDIGTSTWITTQLCFRMPARC
jgi:hypothetical protein